MRTPARCLLVVVLLSPLAACSGLSPTPTAAPIPTSTPTPTPTPLPTPTPTPIPVTDPDPLAIEPPPRPFDYAVVHPQPPRRVPNATRTFWVAHGHSGERRQISARLRVQTDRVAVWVEEGVWHDVRQLEAAALFFESQIYPTTRATFGSEWTPGVDNDPHLHVLHATGLGQDVLGYTSSADEFPRAVYPFSNQAEMIVVNVDAVEAGSHVYYALLARQLQRLIQWSHDRNEDRWVKEGLADLAVWLNGLDPGDLAPAYLAQPDTSLVGWEDDAAHRGASYLFAFYFYERFGDPGARALVAQPANGVAGFDAALAELDAGLTFEGLFADWLAANLLDEEGVYGYASLDLPAAAPAATYHSYPASRQAQVQQLGAHYLVLQGQSDLRVRFTGAAAARLLDLSPHEGSYCWWSNRADESQTTLTRSFDLSGLEQATLSYWAWYDLEPGYDYVALELSSDGGQQWQALPVPSGTGDDPHGNNPGWAYTGFSGGWVREEVDLSPYVGGQVVIRFAYLTDEAVTGLGFALDEVAIPELDYAEGAEEGSGGWQAAGFMRTSGFVPQRYLALLVGGSEPATVERLAVAEDGTAEWTVPLGSRGWDEAVLVISALAPLSDHPASYALTIEAP